MTPPTFSRQFAESALRVSCVRRSTGSFALWELGRVAASM